MAGVIKVGGADLKDVKLSVKSTQQDHYEWITKTSLCIKEKFSENLPLPPILVVRWDVKKITYDKQKKKDSILVSLPGVEEGGTKKKY